MIPAKRPLFGSGDEALEADAEKLKRRRAVAEAMLTQSMRPDLQTQVVGGQAVRRHPLEALVPIAQAYFGGKEQEAADLQAKELRRRERENVAQALAEYQQATTARPAVPGRLEEDASGNVTEGLGTPAYSPGAAERRAAATRLAARTGGAGAMTQALIADSLKTPALKHVDLGDRIAVVSDQGQIVGYLPKSATPGEVLRERGAADRHATPSGSALAAERGAADRHRTPSGSAQLASETAVRGQDLVDQRTREANTIAGNHRGDQATTALREEFNRLPEVKNYRNVAPMIDSARRAPDTVAGDIELAYTVGKILDPDSVIREGELKLVGQAGSLLERFRGELRALTEGKGRLTPATRTALMEMMEGRVGHLQAAHDAARQAYEGVARARGLPTEQIFVEIRHGAGGGRGGARSREDILREYGVSL